MEQLNTLLNIIHKIKWHLFGWADDDMPNG